jgi:hypothetical protein
MTPRKATQNNMSLLKKYSEDFKIYLQMQRSPIFFIEQMWQLTPQKVKPEYQSIIRYILVTTDQDWEREKRRISADWFEPFVKGRDITWQQWLILVCIEKALRGDASRKISIASGHGVGKSSCVSWIILWFLFCFYDAQVPCTAPTADQMYDVLWKELSLWISRMPSGIKPKYEWTTDHIRMTESPETWFARAKTATKENTEALAGVHSNHVLTIADEASGVPEQVFNTAEGAWTSGNILVLLISNPTRIEGYFYDTHHKLKHLWQTLQFSSIDSPIVDPTFEANIAERHGRGSTDYGIRVTGTFPKGDIMDDSGYISLLTENQINEQPDMEEDYKFLPNSILGVDPAGEGDDKTSWVIRDQFKAKKIHEESISTSKTIAEKTITFINKYRLDPRNVVIDAFGKGQDVGKEIAIATKGRMNVTTVNTGDPSEYDADRYSYLNKRAESYYKAKGWLCSGGEIVENKNLKEELLGIKYKRNLKGKIQIMPKVDMKKKYGTKSPNDADAFSLTFLREIYSVEEEDRYDEVMANYDPEDPDGDWRFDPC